jgi:peptidyl-dipeptidase Dcp
MAQLLGYANFSDYKLETEMAKSSQNVRDLLMAVWTPAKERAIEDEKVLTDMLQADGINGPLEPWDWRYYSEKRRQAEHSLDEAEVKSYFQLDRMIDAAFDVANRLFKLEFRPITLPLYHPDCRAWEVTRDGEHIAVFVGDYFARGSKRSGAWCSAMRSQAKFPISQKPIVVNVCNFAKDTPALLSADDVRTLFHEFGHALHQMLSDVTYEMVSGTSVPRDFVELPSQLYEHWAMVPEILQKYATHHATGAPMPVDLMDRIIAASNYDMGFQTVEFAASALVDLEFHHGPLRDGIMETQAAILSDLGLPRSIPMRHATPHFQHVFSSGYYASAYYSYMWAEVMDADAFQAFEDVGDPFHAETAQSLERNILSRGGSVDPAVLYTEFRGRLPEVDALLKGRGLVA